jgi:streptogramin lyase
LLLPCLLALPGLAAAQVVAYGSGLRDLYRINLDAGAATRVGAYTQAPIVPPEVVDVEGLAFAPDGQLYGVADGLNALYRFNPTTGRATRIGPLTGLPSNQGGFDFGLTFTADGRLWLSSDTTKQLWEVNPATGAVRLVGNLGVMISGLAARGNEVFGIGVTDTVTSPADQGLWRIDVETATATLVGRFEEPFPVVDAGLDFDTQGRLWAVLDFNPRPVKNFRTSELVRLDPNTGAILERRVLSGLPTDDIEGLAIAPPNLVPTGTVAALPVPTLGWTGLLILGLLAGLAGAWAARRLTR